MTTLKQLKEELREEGYSEKDALTLARDTVQRQKAKAVHPSKKSSAVFVAPAAGLAAFVALLRK